MDFLLALSYAHQPAPLTRASDPVCHAMSILVTTPTGNVGSRVAARLIEENVEFSVFARTPETLPPAVQSHATVHQGDLEAVDTLKAALDGIDSMFFVIPPNMQTDDWRGWQQQIATNAAQAAEATDVDRIVFLSSAGAQYKDIGPVTGLGEAEHILERAVPRVVALRAGYFMENFLQFAGSIAEEHTIYHAFPADKEWPMVATQDIGDAAVDELLRDAHSGHRIQGVHGPTDLSHAEAASIIGEEIGLPVEYVSVPMEALKEQMRAMDLSENVVDNYAAMINGLIRLSRDDIEPRTPDSTTPTTLASFTETVLQPAIDAAPNAS
jgi:uncharacterized protein YbjT (DUF2867 family)